MDLHFVGKARRDDTWLQDWRPNAPNGLYPHHIRQNTGFGRKPKSVHESIPNAQVQDEAELLVLEGKERHVRPCTQIDKGFDRRKVVAFLLPSAEISRSGWLRLAQTIHCRHLDRTWRQDRRYHASFLNWWWPYYKSDMCRPCPLLKPAIHLPWSHVSAGQDWESDCPCCYTLEHSHDCEFHSVV